MLVICGRMLREPRFEVVVSFEQAFERFTHHVRRIAFDEFSV